MKIEVTSCLEHAVNAKCNEPSRGSLHCIRQAEGTDRKTFSCYRNKFRATREPRGRESGGHRYFLAPPDSHIFSPYFRVPKRGRYFFTPQRYTLWTLRPTRPSVQQEHAFSAATKLNVRGLWRTELRIVNCRHERWHIYMGTSPAFYDPCKCP